MADAKKGRPEATNKRELEGNPTPDLANSGKYSDFEAYSQTIIEKLPVYKTRITSRTGKNGVKHPIAPVAYLSDYEVFKVIQGGVLTYTANGKEVSHDIKGLPKDQLPPIVCSTTHPDPRNVEESEVVAMGSHNGMIDIDFKPERGENVGLSPELVRTKMRDAGLPVPLIDHVTYSGGLRLYYAFDDTALTLNHRERLRTLERAFRSVGVQVDNGCFSPKHLAFLNHDPDAIWNGDNADFKPISRAELSKWGNAPTRAERSLNSTPSNLWGDALDRKLEGYLASVDFQHGQTPDEKWRLCLFNFAVRCAAGGRVDQDTAREWARERFDFRPDEKTTEERFMKIFEEAYESRQTQDASKAQERSARLNPDRFRIRSTDYIKPPTPVLTTPCGRIGVSEGNIKTVSAKAKSKKTFYLQMVTAEYIEERGDLRAGEIMWFDTEQSASHAQKITHRIKALGGGELDEEGFQLYMLRELSPQERVEVIENVCREYSPRLVVLDGVVDLCANFLDLEKSTQTVQQLMTLSSELQCAVVAVIHENKADRNARGHLGTILTQKSETVATLTVDERFADFVEVSFSYTRNEPPQPFTFRIDEEGLPRLSSHALPAIPKGYELWEKCLKQPLGWAELRDTYARLKGITAKTAEAHIKRAVGDRIIAKGDDDMYTLVELEPSINPRQPFGYPLDNEL